jgi:hypothetical protein
VPGGPARRRRDARLGGMLRGMTICESDSIANARGVPDEARRVWPRRRDQRRRRRNCTDAITWSRRLFLSACSRHNVGAHALPLLAPSILSPHLRRSHDAFSQALGSLQPRVPRPFPAPAPTEPARARAACAEARSRTAEIQVGPGDTSSAFVRISTCAASSKSWSSLCVPPIRREQS